MQKMKQTRFAFPLFFSILLGVACVTVNVNFPEATVQKATDDYVRELYRAKEKNKPAPKSTSATDLPTIKVEPHPRNITDSFSLISSAYADGVGTFRVDTDKALAIREKMSARLDKILAQKRAGNIGETNDGLVTLDHGGTVKPILKKSLQPLVDAENKDREDLYQEVLAANGINKNRLKDIQKSFARSFQSESPSGTWVQDGEGKWARKP